MSEYSNSLCIIQTDLLILLAQDMPSPRRINHAKFLYFNLRTEWACKTLSREVIDRRREVKILEPRIEKSSATQSAESRV